MIYSLISFIFMFRVDFIGFLNVTELIDFLLYVKSDSVISEIHRLTGHISNFYIK